jgi:hypothetical protein
MSSVKGPASEEGASVHGPRPSFGLLKTDFLHSCDSAIKAIVTICFVNIHREQEAGWALAEMATDAFAVASSG